MAHRKCREDDGEIRFDYDMAIAAPVPDRQCKANVDMWPMFKTLGAEAAARRPWRSQ